MAGGDEGVSVEETAMFGGVIAALQVIKFGFLCRCISYMVKNADFRVGSTCPYGLPVFPSAGTAAPRHLLPKGRLSDEQCSPLRVTNFYGLRVRESTPKKFFGYRLVKTQNHPLSWSFFLV